MQTIVLDDFWGKPTLDTSQPKRARVDSSNLAYIEFTVRLGLLFATIRIFDSAGINRRD